ncbi:MAG: hypothetical protein VX498_09690, partial [Myxococcota bacterium]|nr:hypothetical protein [Myxococcota bacterium]
DLAIFGESRISYYTDEGNYICSLVADIEGWVEEEIDPADVGCVGCTENFTLGFSPNDDSNCNHSIPGAATIAMTPVSFFPLDTQPEWQWEILTETEDLPEDAGGPALGYLSTNWSPTGPSDWGPRAALYPAGEETGLDTYSREYYARGFYVWISSNGRAYWDMNLWLLE